MHEPIKLTTVFKSLHPWEAHLARHVLERADIETHVVDENTARIHWLRAMAIGGIKLQVPGRDADRARQLLLEWTNQKGAEPELLDCPRCVIMKNRFNKWHWVYVLTTMLTLGIPLFFRRVRHCPQCGKRIRVY